MSPGTTPFQSDIRPGFRSPPSTPGAPEISLKTSLYLATAEVTNEGDVYGCRDDRNSVLSVHRAL